MKNMLRERIKVLANQIITDEKSFETSVIKEKVGQLYDRLTILEYLEAQIEPASEKNNEPEKSSLDSKSFREENWFTEPEQLPKSLHTEDLIEPLMEKIKDIVAQMPEEANRIDEMLAEVLPKNPAFEDKKRTTINDIEVFAESYQKMPEFERKNPTDVKKEDGKLDFDLTSNEKISESKKSDSNQEPAQTVFVKEPDAILDKKEVNPIVEQRTKSLNDSVNQGLNVGLNDRLAFIKHLFDESAEDYARVLSQINTMSSYDEAVSFIKGQVKPDYNYWLNKDMYAERFMALVEKRFN